MIKTEAENMVKRETSKKKREYGIDALRILSMFMVVVLHMLLNGGVLDHVELLSSNYRAAWLLETAAFCAVNCYGLISGYVGIGSKYKFSNLVTLWLQVAFYTVGITAVFAIIKPGSVGLDRVIAAFCPVTFVQYWYFTAYFLLFLIMPGLNLIIEKLPKRKAGVLIVVLTAMATLPTILFNRDPFYIGNGYSSVWLAVLYLLGAYFKKYECLKKISAFIWLIIYALCVLVTWIFKIMMLQHGQGYDFVLAINSETLLNYLSPTILFAAIALLGAFLRFKPGRITTKIIAFVSPLAFSVYLIHVHPFIWNVFTYKLADFANYPTYKMVFGVLGVSAVLFLACAAVDFVRLLVFKALKIKQRIMKLEDKLMGENHD